MRRDALRLATLTAALAAAAGACSDGPVGLVHVDPRLAAEIPIAPNYGIHDTYVRDGIAFVAAWNTGVIIFDVGDGRAGGSPEHPVEISRLVPSANDVPGGPAVHNAWWFKDPSTGSARYLFLGQEGPGAVGQSSTGDIHVLDVSDLANPVEVAGLRIPGAGAHNFWMDESAAVLYAAYYNAGVIAVDVSGELAGDLSDRVIATVAPGGAGATFTWGVQLAAGALWASDMVSGFWKLDPATLSPIGGGQNVETRWGADLWVRPPMAYTGTWGGVARDGSFGNLVNVWSVSGSEPVLVDSIVVDQVRTVSDLQVSEDGALLAVTAEKGDGAGLHLYSLADPAHPVRVASIPVEAGLHTGTVATIAGRIYVFAARNPPSPALMIYDVTPEP
ncbi:MAG: hypothetical protein R2909_19485 [Gemmatimonadales bacterium]